MSLSRQDFEIFEVMCSKNGVFRNIWGYVQGARNFFGFFMHQRVNVNANKVVRINVKTWYGCIFVKKNRSWLFNSSFWRERVVLNDDIWENNQKNFLCPVHNLKSSESWRDRLILISDSDSTSKITPEMIFRFPTTNTNPLFADLCNRESKWITKPNFIRRKRLNWINQTILLNLQVIFLKIHKIQQKKIKSIHQFHFIMNFANNVTQLTIILDNASSSIFFNNFYILITYEKVLYFFQNFYWKEVKIVFIHKN